MQLLILLLSILIIINKNPILHVIYLITIFSGVAIYLIICGIKFIGLSYILVYVGAVSIIFIFILMLIDIRISELNSDTNNNIFLCIIISLIYYNLFINYNNNSICNSSLEIWREANINMIDTLNYSIFNNWDGILIENYDVISIGNIIYTNTSIWLIISLLTLLLAMIGSIKINITSNIQK